MLHRNRLFPQGLVRGDEGAAHVFAFDDPQAEGSPRGPAVADGRRYPRIGDPHHQVCGDRRFPSQNFPGPDPGAVDIDPIDDAVGPGKVDVLKGTHRPPGLFAETEGKDLILVDDDHFPGLDVPDKLPADGGYGAGLAGEDPPAVELPQAQGPDAVGVPGSHQGIPGKDHQGVGALDKLDRIGQGLFQALLVVLGDEVDDHLAVAGGGKAHPGVFQQFPNHIGIGQGAVVGHRDGPQLEAAYKGLGIFDAAGPRGGVPHMAHRRGPPDLGQQFGVEHIPHEAHSPAVFNGVIMGPRNPRALLTPVLER
ncbi:hypothetical protein FACS189468_6300 [Spirochaetia bacterium]|nr:hypothetical protein FACS189468_6300 [Spirochaetia bacterium]